MVSISGRWPAKPLGCDCDIFPRTARDREVAVDELKIADRIVSAGARSTDDDDGGGGVVSRIFAHIAHRANFRRPSL